MSVAAAYGPNSGLVDGVLGRARRLQDGEAIDLLDANRRMLVTNQRLSVALRDVVYAAYRSGREDALGRAEQAGRDAVQVFPASRRQAAVAGVVGRLCETLVVLELLPLDSREVLLAPWRSVIDDTLGREVRTPFGR